jgi:hypothetical protein
MAPAESGEAIIRETVLHVFIKENISNIFWRTTCPEKLKCAWNFSDIVQKQLC